MASGGAMTEAEKKAYDNIKVVVRSRPLNAAEKAAKTASLVTCDSENGSVSVAMNLGSKRGSKKFNYDMVFGPYSTQAEVYQAAIRPVVEEVLLGYNCTVFAYGQTGTGKTFTMEGNVDDAELQGMIPRAVSSIFDRLDQLDEAEYTVKVSFLELYNEELQDLLSATDDVKLRILDDKSRMSTGVACHNLEEVMVKGTSDILNVMKKAMAKRQVGETKLNKASSRSHCIFSMTVHIREVTPEGEDLLKVGKLNLVDLAGSECIGRSGAKNQRAREAGNINKSLLTLGRVISALVEKTPHIPYRDSKLTRLLQESLGGRAKTCIIATVAPSVQCLDETLSTLEYASRAKTIKNKPEANQRMTKRTVLKEYAEDLERLRQELANARAKDGVFLSEERYNEMNVQLESQRLQLEELEEAMEKRAKELNELQDQYDETKEKLELTEEELEATKADLERTLTELEETKAELERQKVLLEETRVLVRAHQVTEGSLRLQSKELQSTLNEVKADVHQLHAKIARKNAVEAHNKSATDAYQKTTIEAVEETASHSAAFCTKQEAFHSALRESLDKMWAAQSKQAGAIKDAVGKLAKDATDHIFEVAVEDAQASRDRGIKHWEASVSHADAHCAATNEALQRASDQVQQPIAELLKDILKRQDEALKQHSGQVDSVLQESEHDIRNFAESHAQQMQALSQKVAADAEESRRALEEQAKKIETFVHTERERIESATSSLVAQFSAMLLSFKDQAQTNLDAVQTEADGMCKASVEAIIRSEMQSKKSVQDVVQSTKNWCDAKVSEVDKLRQQVLQTTAGLEQLSSEARARGESAERHLDAQVQQLQALAQGRCEAAHAHVDVATKQLQGDCADIRTKVEQFSPTLEQDLEASTSVVQELQDSCRAWIDTTQTDSAQAKAQVEAFGASTAEQTRALQQRCNLYVNEDLIDDKPTGATPQKKQYPFDPTIPQTSPHEEILSRYRASKVPGGPAFDLDVMTPVHGEHDAMLSIPRDDKANESIDHEDEMSAGSEVETKQHLADANEACDDGACSNDENCALDPEMDPVSPRVTRGSSTSQSSAPLGEISNASNNKGSSIAAPPPKPVVCDQHRESSGGVEDAEEVLSRSDVMAMKVTQLRKELASRSMSQLGNKATLQQRLLELVSE